MLFFTLEYSIYIRLSDNITTSKVSSGLDFSEPRSVTHLCGLVSSERVKDREAPASMCNYPVAIKEGNIDFLINYLVKPYEKRKNK